MPNLLRLMVISTEVFIVAVEPGRVATQVYIPAIFLVTVTMVSSPLSPTTFPLGEIHCRVGRGAEFDPSQNRCSALPSTTVVSPVVSGGLKATVEMHYCILQGKVKLL